jgi:DNA-binding response OmpR family regulator
MPDVKKILLAEDDEFLAALLKNRLQRDGYAVEIVENGANVVEMLRTYKPDLLLLDIILPNKLGFEIIEDMRADTKLAKMPFMVMSNLGQPEDIERAKQLGAIEYFVKARLVIEDLIKRIASFLATGR